MGDVQLPLRLSTSYYIAVSTSSVGEDTSPTSNAPLFTFPKPRFKFFRLPSHGTKDGNAKRVVVSPNWPFFRVVKSKGSEICSPSPNQDSSSSSSVNDEGDGMGSFASPKSPPEKSSPASSISPASVLRKKLLIEKEADMMEKSNENGGEKIRRDSLDSFMSCDGAPTLSSVVEGEKEMKWDASESFARYDHKLSRSATCSVLDEDGDELFELEITKSESSSVYCNPSTSLRRSIDSDILKAEASHAMEKRSEISEEEIQGDDGNPGKASEVAPSLPDGKKAITCRRDNPYFVLRLFERFSASGPFVLFMGKMLGAIGSSQGSHSTMLWMDVKKRIVLLAASQMRWAGKMNLRVKEGVKHRRVGGGEVELWKKNIPMGRRCRVLELEDSSSYENGGASQTGHAGTRVPYAQIEGPGLRRGPSVAPGTRIPMNQGPAYRSAGERRMRDPVLLRTARVGWVAADGGEHRPPFQAPSVPSGRSYLRELSWMRWMHRAGALRPRISSQDWPAVVVASDATMSGLREAAAKDAAEVHLNSETEVRMNSEEEEAMAEGLSLRELMEAAAEAPVFNWISKEARSV